MATNRNHNRDEFVYGHFPSGFLFGSASSAYQSEGGWNADGKGESIWDRFVHLNPSPIVDKTTGDVAADFYHKYKEDVKLLANMGAKMFRFSINWTRILPDGTPGSVNQPGVDFYNAVINELLANGIQPLITLFHWDLPQKLQDNGGWLNEELMIKAFGDYTRFCFTKFGDRVKHWVTVNEPYVFTWMGYDAGVFAPAVADDPAIKTQFVLTNLLKAHAEAYHIYADEFKAKQKGKVGLVQEFHWMEPVDDSPEAKQAAERAMQFTGGRLLHPIFKGGYHPLFEESMKSRSKLEGRSQSRLPELSGKWIARIKGTADFIGMNHYTTFVARPLTNEELQGAVSKPSIWTDDNAMKFSDPAWPNSGNPLLKVVPWGLRRCLNWVKEEYGNPEVLITENGICMEKDESGSSVVEDQQRLEYHRGYMNELLKAIRLDGCKVTGYLAWCLTDGFEWNLGYTTVFGLHRVDFRDPERKRTPKKSALFLKKVFTDNGFVKDT